MAISDMPRLITNGVMTGTNVLLSGWIDMARIEKAGLEIQITGTPNGTLSLEATNQPNPSNPQQPDPAAVAVTLPGTAVSPALPAVAGGPVSYIGGVFCYTGGGMSRWIRLRYVNSSSAGVLNVFAHRSGPT